MIETLSKFDRATAAGILARAALSIDDAENPSAAFVVPDEAAIRMNLIQELMARLDHNHIASELASPTEELLESIDQELDSVLEPVDEEAELKRLSQKGTLPSDLYEIEMDPVLRKIYGNKWDEEAVHVRETIIRFDREQHFQADDEDEQSALVSLFSKFFRDDKFVNRSFTMLVAGQRQGKKLRILQAWRLYPDRFDLRNDASLVDWLKNFAEKFGFDIRYRDKVSKFFVEVEGNIMKEGEALTVDHQPGKDKKPFEMYFLAFFASNKKNTSSALALAIDIQKYRRMLRTYGW